MNTYTFTYYGFVPGYNDFDQDWIDIIAPSIEEAVDLAKKQVPYRKSDLELVAINGHSLNDFLAKLSVMD